MHSSSRLGLPFVMPAQAQKHVTVNEAFSRLDAAVQLVFVRSTLQTPPEAGPEGHCFLVPAGASGEWADRAGHVAARSNSGWLFLAPSVGWSAWDVESSTRLTFDGLVWSAEPLSRSRSGAATLSTIIEFDHEILPGSANVTAVPIPAHSQVVAVTGRVRSAVEGNGLTGWKLGVEGSDDRYGSGLGLASNSYVLGLSGSPLTYYADTSLRITAEGGDFLRGSVHFCVHLTVVLAPTPL